MKLLVYVFVFTALVENTLFACKYIGLVMSDQAKLVSSGVDSVLSHYIQATLWMHGAGVAILVVLFVLVCCHKRRLCDIDTQHFGYVWFALVFVMIMMAIWGFVLYDNIDSVSSVGFKTHANWLYHTFIFDVYWRSIQLRILAVRLITISVGKYMGWGLTPPTRFARVDTL